MNETNDPTMVNAKRLCRNCGLLTPQAQRAAELMRDAITTDVLHILQTTSTRTIYERINDYFTLNK